MKQTIFIFIFLELLAWIKLFLSVFKSMAGYEWRKCFEILLKIEISLTYGKWDDNKCPIFYKIYITSYKIKLENA